MIDFEIVVNDEQNKNRIDKLLAENMDLSRSRIQQLINEGYVLVNDAETKSNYKVHINDVITCEIPDRKSVV